MIDLPTGESEPSLPHKTFVTIELSFHILCIGLPKTRSKNNAMSMVVEQLTKSTQFIAMTNTRTLD